MARKSILTDTFVAKIRTELGKPNANMRSVASKLKCSPSTIYRATGGKRRLEGGTTEAWLANGRRPTWKRPTKARRTAKPRRTTKRRRAA